MSPKGRDKERPSGTAPSRAPALRSLGLGLGLGLGLALPAAPAFAASAVPSLSFASAFAPPPSPRRSRAPALAASAAASDVDDGGIVRVEGGGGCAGPRRRAFLRSVLTAGSATATAALGMDPARALVKGNAPPPPKERKERKCNNVEECQEMAERFAARQDEEARASSVPASVAPLGSRYRDVEPPPDAYAPVASRGDTVTVYYKVLKLGKRSYDGLSGEGTVVFSRGYGLEDDEMAPGDKSFRFTLGDPTVIDALNDAIPGMALGSTRRISVLPQMGWRRPGKDCDGGPGGSGAGGDLKTDYVVVPTATMVAEEACFDQRKRPFPSAYAQQRRMAQRFDQSLIAEVKLVGIDAQR